MASVSNVTLSLAAGSSSSTTNVTVAGTLTFDASEVGKSYRMEILVMGEDLSGDNLPSTDSGSDDSLYTFKWGSLFLMKPYKQVTVAAAGAQSFTETRAITSTTLDEDSGKVYIGDADINTPLYMPRKDEVYAKVTVSSVPVSARSTTVIAGFGV
jgi:hypothetical protein